MVAHVELPAGVSHAGFAALTVRRHAASTQAASEPKRTLRPTRPGRKKNMKNVRSPRQRCHLRKCQGAWSVVGILSRVRHQRSAGRRQHRCRRRHNLLTGSSALCRMQRLPQLVHWSDAHDAAVPDHGPPPTCTSRCRSPAARQKLPRLPSSLFPELRLGPSSLVTYCYVRHILRDCKKNAFVTICIMQCSLLLPAGQKSPRPPPLDVSPVPRTARPNADAPPVRSVGCQVPRGQSRPPHRHPCQSLHRQGSYATSCR